MAKAKVSGKTHTKAQLDAYANLKNPNNKAYAADKANRLKMKHQNKNSHTKSKYDIGILDGESYGWCDD